MNISDIEAYLLIVLICFVYIFLFIKKYNFLIANRDKYNPDVVTLGFTSKPNSFFDAMKMLIFKVPVSNVSILYKDHIYYYDDHDLFTARRVLPQDISKHVILRHLSFSKKLDFSTILEKSFEVDHTRLTLNLNEQLASNLLIGLGLVENSHSAAKLLDLLG